MQYNPRYYFIDNLRSIALLLGVIFHAALAYGPYFKNIWVSTDPNTQVFFSYLANWLHLFRMPLFFVIAGFCSALIMARKSNQNFIKLRLKRVLVPFLVFYPILVVLFLSIFSWSITVANPLPPLISLLSNIENPQISTMHLWFLWVLTQFCIVHWCLHHFSKVYETLLSIGKSPLMLSVYLTITSYVFLLDQPAPFHAPDKLYPQFWAWGFYGAFYFAGAGLYSYIDKIKLGLGSVLFVACLALVSLYGYFALLPSAPTLTDVVEAIERGYFEPSNEQHSLLVAVQAIAVVSWTLLALQLGFFYLNKENKVSRYISESSYWIYLIHVPLLLCIQLPLTNVDLPALAKFIISVLVTMLLSLFTYHFVVRNKFIGHLLNGKKQKQKQPDSAKEPKREVLE
ncbi:hypothetical protein N474_13220 [Pseudoalteromonas luteoviolacea CPMOR-2]|uniref:Acyltransferase 3 domain-containing protein n=1 Tax=Pseudoalteromonas luteoviolacea DSM 6061 TaxID=1365250 RepID=A0A166UIH7_9GAMM|nr:acyltransferase family protein [Pseudoalteromonas luteoviolacea]KZN30711.1 hypothetical protein N475_24610 [Pseudoalteromonas luteoviolacea DSM 6061]KZN56236.1 hypothetical protein N474_13220 [Pseudoalteromonas luteoviolacea CPMOR-2]MBE0388432.1 hypothetical protein [Pseudoalteromonas luteoviolacea DSM 6061]